MSSDPLINLFNVLYRLSIITGAQASHAYNGVYNKYSY